MFYANATELVLEKKGSRDKCTIMDHEIDFLGQAGFSGKI